MAWKPDSYTTFGHATEFFTGFRKFMEKNKPGLLEKYKDEKYAVGVRHVADEVGLGDFPKDNAVMDDLRQILNKVENG